jgi:hypothetical protein
LSHSSSALVGKAGRTTVVLAYNRVAAGKAIHRSAFRNAPKADAESEHGRLSRSANNSLSAAQSAELGFQHLDPAVALGDRGRDVRGLEALRNMLWAVRVPRRDPVNRMTCSSRAL